MKVLTSKFQYEDLEILVTKKNIKNIYLRVYPPDGRVNLSVQRRFPKMILIYLLTKNIIG